MRDDFIEVIRDIEDLLSNYEIPSHDEILQNIRNIIFGFNVPDVDILIAEAREKCEDSIVNEDWYEITYNNNKRTASKIRISKIDYISQYKCNPLERICLNQFVGGNSLQTLANKIEFDFNNILCSAFVEANEDEETINDLLDIYSTEDLFNKYILCKEKIFDYYTQEKIIQILKENGKV